MTAKERELEEHGELALRALRRAAEKARRPKIVSLEELQSATERLAAAGFDIPVPRTEPEDRRETFRADPNLGLAVVRAEIEGRLRVQAAAQGITVGDRGILDLLWRGELLPQPQASALAHLMHLLNAAVHGAEATKGTDDWAATVGLSIVSALAS